MKKYNLLLLFLALLLIVPSAMADYTLMPFDTAQPAPRPAYQALFRHIGEGGRAHWAQRSFMHDGRDYAAGSVVAPEGIAGSGFEQTVVSGTLAVSPSLALDGAGTRVAVFRSTVGDSYGAAAWEVGDVTDVFDSYLLGALRYTVLDEADLATADLSRYAVLILPAVRAGNEPDVIGALGPATLGRITGFVRAGGFLYAQGNGASIAEAAGVVAAGTVDLAKPLRPRPGGAPNTGVLTATNPLSPLALSWLTDTLYLLDDPVLRPGPELETVAAYTNLTEPDQPAVVTGAVGSGRVILVAGHPTDPARRAQLPLFLNAMLWALGHPAELFGDAVQTYNPALDRHLLPAYEPGTPVSTTLTLNNVWDAPLGDAVITETVAVGFTVLADTLSPSGTLIMLPDGRSQIVWQLGSVAPGAVTLGFQAVTGRDALHEGAIDFSTGVATFVHEGRPHTISHRPFALQSRMAARLQIDRDIEADRHFTIPAEGLFLDVTVPIENKEETLASGVVLTDVIPLISPIVDLEDQETILGQNNGKTVWVRNEVFFYNERGGPYLPAEGYTLTDTIDLDDWQGQYAVFDVPHGTHGEISLDGLGNYITIPAAYQEYIKLTPDGKLLLPVAVVRWKLGDWPGYHYAEPALRYGINLRELTGRPVTFAGDPGITPDDIVVRGTGGSVYTHLGDRPVLSREHLSSGLVYVPLTSATPAIGYHDLWQRQHEVRLRAAFVDIFSWASCACGDGLGERHAGLNVTFAMRADVNGDGRRDERVLIYPSRAGVADLDVVIKDRSMGSSIAADEMLIDMGMFRGLGITILPRSGDWRSSWRSSSPSTRLITTENELAIDHLLFQHNVPAGATVAITLEARISNPVDRAPEGMLKLHDGARYTYRQQSAGPSRYEVYDTHVQGVLGEASQVRVRKQSIPKQISTYGDLVYYLFTITDRDEPRHLIRNGPGDPFLQSYGYGDLAATTYVGGREGRDILHSIVRPGELTRIRVELNNNRPTTLSGVKVTPVAPPGISITPLYTNPAQSPAPIFNDLPFLNAARIAETGRGVYYFDVRIAPDYAGPRGQVIELPILLQAEGAPADFRIPAARLGIADANDQALFVSGPAQTLDLTDEFPVYAQLQGAALVSSADMQRLTAAPDRAGREAVFASFTNTLSTTGISGTTRFVLPGDAVSRLYHPGGSGALYVIAQASINPPSAGPNVTNLGAQVRVTDGLGMTWSHQSERTLAEAHGASVQVRYSCTGVVTGTATLALGAGAPTPDCLLEAGTTNTVALDIVVANHGDYIAQGITTTLTLPPGVGLVSSSPMTATGIPTPTWQLGDLGPGGVRVVRAVVWLQVDAAGQAQNLAAPQATQPSVMLIKRTSGTFVDTFSAAMISADLAHAFALPVRTVSQGRSAALQIRYECVSVNGQIPGISGCQVGADTASHVTVDAVITNTGDYAARATLLALNLPAGVTLLSARPAPATGSTWNLGDIAPGLSTTIRMVLLVPPPGNSAAMAPVVGGAEAQFTDARLHARVWSRLSSSYDLPVRGVMADGARLTLTTSCVAATPGDPRSSCVLRAAAANEVTLDLTVANQGSAAAQGLTATIEVPGGVSIRNPGSLVVSGTTLAWDVGDLPAGATRTVRVVLSVEQVFATASTRAVLGVATARYIDGASDRSINTRLSDNYTLGVRQLGPTLVYLPVLQRQVVRQPDLVVTSFTVTPAQPRVNQPVQLSITIENQGLGASGAFWVDLYLDPQVVPDRAGVRWDTTCRTTSCQGMAWSVKSLAPGERVTLTSAPTSYNIPYSRWLGRFTAPGTHNLYVYVDSWGGSDGRGAVIESNETNNRASVLDLRIAATAASAPSIAQPFPLNGMWRGLDNRSRRP